MINHKILFLNLFCAFFFMLSLTAQTITSVHYFDENGILVKTPLKVSGPFNNSLLDVKEVTSSLRLYLSGSDKKLTENPMGDFPGYYQDIDATNSAEVWDSYFLSGDIEGIDYSFYIWAVSPYIYSQGQTTTYFRAEIIINSLVVATIDFSSSSSTISSGKKYTVTGTDPSTTEGDTVKLKISYRGGYGGTTVWGLGSPGSYIEIPSYISDYGNFGPQQVITVLADGALSVYTADLDGDGDMDVLSASIEDDKIAWYENTDGQGTFGDQQVITVLADGALSVYTADLDSDGDMDVLSASFEDDKIAWYENTDGQGTFGDQQVITVLADGASSVYAADLDNDGDMDVLSASSYDDKIAWYENTDGQGTFGDQQVITVIADRARSVYAADLDNDGNMDVLSASYYDDKIAWYENTDGQGTFGDQQVITVIADGARSVYAADLDNDGNMDVLSASSFDDKIAWYENTDGQGTFGDQQVITVIADGANSVYAADLDNDGDMDVLSASSYDHKIAWYENTDGQGTFGDQQVITVLADWARSVYAADLDSDGDMDVLSATYSATYNDDKIAWYPNLLIDTYIETPVTTGSLSYHLYQNYPNPFNPSTTIGFSLPEAGLVDLVIFSVMGQKVRKLLSKHMAPGIHSIVWDGCDDRGIPVSAGIYFSRLHMNNSSVSGRMILVK